MRQVGSIMIISRYTYLYLNIQHYYVKRFICSIEIEK